MGLATVVGGGVVLAGVSSKRTAHGHGASGCSAGRCHCSRWRPGRSPVTVFAALAVVGVSDPLVNVGLDTIPQRVVHDRVLSRVFGAMEAALVGAMSVGALIARSWSTPSGCAAPCCWSVRLRLPAVAVSLPRMRRLDGQLAEPEGMAVLETLPMFAPLGQGDAGDARPRLGERSGAGGSGGGSRGRRRGPVLRHRAGVVEVTQGERFLRRGGPGEFFGEIGLLRDVPRTATVIALEDTVLWRWTRRAFLDAVAGQRDAASRRRHSVRAGWRCEDQPVTTCSAAAGAPGRGAVLLRVRRHPGCAQLLVLRRGAGARRRGSASQCGTPTGRSRRAGIAPPAKPAVARTGDQRALR